MPAACFAGPPFVTDDPVPTDYRNWEIYTGFTYDNDDAGSAGTPFAEFNYGAMPNVQTSLAFSRAEAEFGVKTRFVQESGRSPQISFYPSVTIASEPGRKAAVLLPLWLQKSWGPWTAFGGGGVTFGAQPTSRGTTTLLGGALERQISPGTTVGAELYHVGANEVAERVGTSGNVGVVAQVGRYHAILFSIGRTFAGGTTFSTYASYEFALGPDARGNL